MSLKHCQPRAKMSVVVTTTMLNQGCFSKHFEQVVSKKQTQKDQENCFFTEACGSIYNVLSRAGICLVFNGCVLSCSSCQGLVSCTL